MSHAEEQGTKAPPPRMSTAARADSMTVEDVIKLASEGRLRMPSFQRPFRWEAGDRRALVDSIYRGYPVGTLLLWKNPPSDTEVGRPLDGVDTARARGDQYLVVDGQQRLTTLWEALGRVPKRGENALVFDIEREQVLTRALTPDELEGSAADPEGREAPASAALPRARRRLALRVGPAVALAGRPAALLRARQADPRVQAGALRRRARRHRGAPARLRPRQHHREGDEPRRGVRRADRLAHRERRGGRARAGGRAAERPRLRRDRAEHDLEGVRGDPRGQGREARPARPRRGGRGGRSRSYGGRAPRDHRLRAGGRPHPSRRGPALRAAARGPGALLRPSREAERAQPHPPAALAVAWIAGRAPRRRVGDDAAARRRRHG